MEPVEALQLLHRPLVVVDPEIDEQCRRARRSRRPARRRAVRPTAGRGGRRRRPAQRRGSRAAARRVACRPWLERRQRVRRRSPPRRGCCPGRRSGRRCGRRPTRGTRAGVRRRAALRVDDAELALVAVVVRARQALHDLVGTRGLRAAGRGRPARSAGWRTTASRSRRRAARPRARPSRRRGTSTASRHPTGPRRGRRRRSSTCETGLLSHTSAFARSRSSSASVGDERARDLGSGERSLDLLGGRPGRRPGCPRSCAARSACDVVDGVEDERVLRGRACPRGRSRGHCRPVRRTSARAGSQLDRLARLPCAASRRRRQRARGAVRRAGQQREGRRSGSARCGSRRAARAPRQPRAGPS